MLVQMGKIYEWLNRSLEESVSDYDNRINSLAAFHAGYAFLSSVNYHGTLEGFAVYTVWNSELNAKLEAPLPCGGFMMHCDLGQAQELLRYGDAYPVFLRLSSKAGRLYAEHLLIADRDKLFDLYYNGCEVIPPENTAFRKYPMPENVHFDEKEQVNDVLSVVQSSGFGLRNSSFGIGNYVRGSFRRGRNLTGSYTRSSFRVGSLLAGSGGTAIGSFRIFGQGSFRFWGLVFGGSFRGGSFRYGSLLTRAGSFVQSELNHESFRLGSYSAGSFSGGNFLRGSYITGIYGTGSYVTGRWTTSSYLSGSFTIGSFYSKFYNGSYYNGGYHRGSYVYGGCNDRICADEAGSYEEDILVHGEDSMLVLRGNIPIRRLIEEMGYGLDLI